MENQWDILTDSLLALFVAIGISDGQISKKEFQTASQIWQPKLRQFQYNNEQTQQLYYECVVQMGLDKITKSPKISEEDCWEQLEKLGQMVAQRLNPEEHQGFYALFMELATDVAKASRGPLGLGPKIRQEEVEAMQRLSRILARKEDA